MDAKRGDTLTGAGTFGVLIAAACCAGLPAAAAFVGGLTIAASVGVLAGVPALAGLIAVIALATRAKSRGSRPPTTAVVVAGCEGSGASLACTCPLTDFAASPEDARALLEAAPSVAREILAMPVAIERAARPSADCSNAMLRRSRMPTGIELDELQRLLANDAQLVEVLPRDEYEEMHLPGAIHLPLKELNRDTARQLDPGRAVVVYCWDAL